MFQLMQVHCCYCYCYCAVAIALMRCDVFNLLLFFFSFIQKSLCKLKLCVCVCAIARQVSLKWSKVCLWICRFTLSWPSIVVFITTIVIAIPGQKWFVLATMLHDIRVLRALKRLWESMNFENYSSIALITFNLWTITTQSRVNLQYTVLLDAETDGSFFLLLRFFHSKLLIQNWRRRQLKILCFTQRKLQKRNI